MKKSAVSTLIGVFFNLCLGFPAAAQKGWPGVDDAVIGKYASEAGRAPASGLLSLDGDVLLFAFLLAGVVGGFVMGYFFRDFARRRACNPGPLESDPKRREKA